MYFFYPLYIMYPTYTLGRLNNIIAKEVKDTNKINVYSM